MREGSQRLSVWDDPLIGLAKNNQHPQRALPSPFHPQRPEQRRQVNMLLQQLREPAQL